MVAVSVQLVGGMDAPPRARWKRARRVIVERSGAVIDGIEVLSDGSYPAPHVISISGDRQQACGGPWPVTGRQNFYRACAAGGLVPLLGRAAPARSRVDVPGLGPVTYPGIGAPIKAAPPGRAGCWMVTSIVIHYHVGIRHYTATYGTSLTACSSKSGQCKNSSRSHRFVPLPDDLPRVKTGTCRRSRRPPASPGHQALGRFRRIR
jgi:hypothetical protein